MASFTIQPTPSLMFVSPILVDDGAIAGHHEDDDNDDHHHRFGTRIERVKLRVYRPYPCLLLFPFFHPYPQSSSHSGSSTSLSVVSRHEGVRSWDEGDVTYVR